jgi:hypothetical protein
MNTDTSPLSMLVASIWFGAGACGLIVALRHRARITALPDTPGHRRLKRQRRLILVVSVLMLAVGLWNTIAPLVWPSRTPIASAPMSPGQ